MLLIYFVLTVTYFLFLLCFSALKNWLGFEVFIFPDGISEFLIFCTDSPIRRYADLVVHRVLSRAIVIQANHEVMDSAVSYCHLGDARLSAGCRLDSESEYPSSTLKWTGLRIRWSHFSKYWVIPLMASLALRLFYYWQSSITAFWNFLFIRKQHCKQGRLKSSRCLHWVVNIYFAVNWDFHNTENGELLIDRDMS